MGGGETSMSRFYFAQKCRESSNTLAAGAVTVNLSMAGRNWGYYCSGL